MIISLYALITDTGSRFTLQSCEGVTTPCIKELRKKIEDANLQLFLKKYIISTLFVKTFFRTNSLQKRIPKLSNVLHQNYFFFSFFSFFFFFFRTASPILKVSVEFNTASLAVTQQVYSLNTGSSNPASIQINFIF